MKITNEKAMSCVKAAGLGKDEKLAKEFRSACDIYLDGLLWRAIWSELDEGERDDALMTLLDFYLCGREDENARIATTLAKMREQEFGW